MRQMTALFLFGFRLGSNRAQAAAMFERGATQGEIEAATGYTQYNTFSGKNYKSILSHVAPEYEILLGLVLGIFLAEQLLHYYCDRSLFRFRDPRVRRAVAPLL